jgi:ferredoxin--NADP+ reductase
MVRFVAIVGSGPAGFYGAEELLRHVNVSVDMIDRLPTPFGLVRAGIAPDHQKTKLVVRSFERTAAHPRFRFFGNLEIGRVASVEELLRFYDAVIFAHGAAAGRRLGIPGEDKRGVFSAHQFVGWYNGHPDFAALDVHVPEEVVVAGNGNVAADVARVLLMPIKDLEKTDIARHALQAIRGSAARRVHLAGRKGPADGRFTSPELKELINLLGVDVRIAGGAEVFRGIDRASLSDNARKNLDLLHAAMERPQLGSGRSLIFHFHAAPTLVEGAASVQGVALRRADHSTTRLSCGLFVTCIGNVGLPFGGLPFHEQAGTVRNSRGRVEDEQGAIPGLYVTGWAKRGAAGTVGTNRADSQETCAALVSDLPGLPMRCGPPDHFYVNLRSRGCRIVSYGDWLRIDESEVRAGGGAKPREKYVHVEAMLHAAGQHPLPHDI